MPRRLALVKGRPVRFRKLRAVLPDDPDGTGVRSEWPEFGAGPSIAPRSAFGRVDLGSDARLAHMDAYAAQVGVVLSGRALCGGADTPLEIAPGSGQLALRDPLPALARASLEVRLLARSVYPGLLKGERLLRRILRFPTLGGAPIGPAEIPTPQAIWAAGLHEGRLAVRAQRLDGPGTGAPLRVEILREAGGPVALSKVVGAEVSVLVTDLREADLDGGGPIVVLRHEVEVGDVVVTDEVRWRLPKASHLGLLQPTFEAGTTLRLSRDADLPVVHQPLAMDT